MMGYDTRGTTSAMDRVDSRSTTASCVRMSKNEVSMMFYNNYIGPERQLMPPGYELLIQQFGELGATLKCIWDGIAQIIGKALPSLMEVFGNIWTGKPRRSKLRLHRHKTQHEKRISWKYAHVQSIHDKEAKIYLRRVGVL